MPSFTFLWTISQTNFDSLLESKISNHTVSLSNGRWNFQSDYNCWKRWLCSVINCQTFKHFQLFHLSATATNMSELLQKLNSWLFQDGREQWRKFDRGGVLEGLSPRRRAVKDVGSQRGNVICQSDRPDLVYNICVHVWAASSCILVHLTPKPGAGWLLGGYFLFQCSVRVTDRTLLSVNTNINVSLRRYWPASR